MIILFFNILFNALLLNAQTLDANLTKSDQLEVLKVVKDLSAAVNRVDVEKAIGLMNERIVFINIPGTVTIGLPAIRRYFDMMLFAKDAYLKSAKFDFEVEGAPLIIDRKFALLHGHSINHYVFSGGGVLDLPINWSGALIKENGQWKVLSLQVAGNLFKNPLLEEFYKMVIIIGSIVLILVSFIFYKIGYYRGRTKKSNS